MTAATSPEEFALPLDLLELGTKARVAAIDWDSLDPMEANRLKHFGFDEGVSVEALHLGPFGRDPIAIRVGRMTVAIRRRHAGAVRVVPLAQIAGTR
jgi:ferrous iron transport protein A